VLIFLVTWSVRLFAVSGYGAVAWWRARRAILDGALDDEVDAAFGQPPSAVVRERGILGWIKGPEGPLGAASTRTDAPSLNGPDLSF
jgi:hypothetical protein